MTAFADLSVELPLPLFYFLEASPLLHIKFKLH